MREDDVPYSWADAILDAEPEEVPALLADADLKEWLQIALEHQLSFQRVMSSPGSFDLLHPALDMEQHARLRALGYLPASALPEIVAALVHPETAGSNPVVWSLCDALVRMETAGAEAKMPLLDRLLRDGITEYPSRVVGALVAVAPGDDLVRQSLESALDAEDETGVLAALYALPALQASGSLSKVLSLTASDSAEVRSGAALALGALAGNSADASEKTEAQNRLLQLTHDPEWFVRGNAIDSLGALDTKDSAVREAALRILAEDDSTPDWSAPECAARTLAHMGGSEQALEARLLTADVSAGLAEECILALKEAGVTGWEDKVRDEYGYLFEEDDDEDDDFG